MESLERISQNLKSNIVSAIKCIWKCWLQNNSHLVRASVCPWHMHLPVHRVPKHNVNTLRSRQDGRRFADNIFKCIFLNENVWIPIKISLKFVPRGPISNIPALVQIISEAITVNLVTHICVTRPQWVKTKHNLFSVCLSWVVAYFQWTGYLITMFRKALDGCFCFHVIELHDWL